MLTGNLFQDTGACVILPTYNNEITLAQVLNDILSLTDGTTSVIVVNDGSTDATSAILAEYKGKIELIQYDQNQGKGYAIRQGFRKAIELGFSHAITIDSDGQHFPSDVAALLEASKQHPTAVIMGARNMDQEGVPGKSSFGNKFSNFWFRIETFIKLPDTQTGFRLYPLAPISRMKFFTKKFEFEIEIIVRLAWKGIPFHSVPIQVLYNESERVSHFRPFKDFMRISILNTVLVTICLFYFYPKTLFSKKTIDLIKKEAVKPDESNWNKALSLAFGCFMGIVPIWGFQLLIGIPLAIVFRLNKVLFIAGAHISIQPLIPLILYGSWITGQLVITGEINHSKIWDTSFDSITENMFQYMVGAVILAMLVFVFVLIVSYPLLSLLRKGPNQQYHK